MSYATDFVDYLKRTGKKSFTHRDILIITGTNCPHAVLKHGIKPLLDKLGFIITVKNEERNNKKYSRYYLEERENG